MSIGFGPIEFNINLEPYAQFIGLEKTQGPIHRHRMDGDYLCKQPKPKKKEEERTTFVCKSEKVICFYDIIHWNFSLSLFFFINDEYEN